MAHTDEIAHRLSEVLLPGLPDFRYARSRTQLRKKGEEFSDDLIIDVASRSGTSYTIAFYIGVVHTDTEKLIGNLEDRKVGPYNRTVFQYSVNQRNLGAIGFEGDTWWCGLERDTDLSTISHDVRRFVKECVHPYFEYFHSLARMRESLVTRDGLNLNQYPFKQVLAIDALLGDKEHIGDYLNLLQAEVNDGYYHDSRVFNEFYDLIAGRFPHLFSAFELQPKQRA